MATISLKEAQAALGELIHSLRPGEELAIVENDRVIAKLIGETQDSPRPRRRGSAKGKLIIQVEDDEHLNDFGAYMP